MLDGDPAPLPKKGAEPLPSFRPMTIVAKRLDGLRCDFAWRYALVQACSSSPPKKGAEPPIFGHSLLWPNGWMHQDATWYGGRPQPRQLSVRWGPCLLPKRGRSPQFSAHVYCGQTGGCIKMPLGTEVGLGSNDVVLHGDPPSPPKEKGIAPKIFGPYLLWPNGCMYQDTTWY